MMGQGQIRRTVILGFGNDSNCDCRRFWSLSIVKCKRIKMEGTWQLKWYHIILACNDMVIFFRI